MWWTKPVLRGGSHLQRRGAHFVATSENLKHSKGSTTGFIHGSPVTEFPRLLWAEPAFREKLPGCWTAYQAAKASFRAGLRPQCKPELSALSSDQQQWVHFLETWVQLLASEASAAKERLAAVEAAAQCGLEREERLRRQVEELQEQLEVERQRCSSSAAPAADGDSRVLAPAPRLRVLYASPLSCGQHAVSQLSIEEEVATISEAMGGAMEIDVDVATLTSLRKALSEKGVWLHLSLHCLKKYRSLVLESTGGSSRARLLRLQDLELLLQNCSGADVEFLFLSACESEEFASIFRAAGVKHVVCCSSRVSDLSATQFAGMLYHELANQKTLETAFQTAALHARLNGDEAKYSLLSDGSPWHSVPQALHRHPPARAAVKTQGLPRPVEDFVGRLDVFDATLQALSVRRCVVLHCEAARGRSSALVQIGRYACMPGRIFAGRVTFFPKKAAGGLWIVDDADELLTGDGQQQLQRHLATEGAALLLGCRDAHYDPFHGAVKAINMNLPSLRPRELADIFLKQCQRQLRLADVCAPEEIKPSDEAQRVLNRHEALEQLEGKMGVFGGLPGLVRLAAANVFEGSPSICGNFSNLMLKLCDKAPDLSSSISNACMGNSVVA